MDMAVVVVIVVGVALVALLAIIVAPSRSIRAEGSHAEIGPDGRVVSVRPGRGDDPRLRKTVNAASFGERSWLRGFRPAVEALIEEGRATEFYEAAIDAAVRAGRARLLAVEADDGAWTEVDDPADLARAESREARQPRPSSTWDAPAAPQG